jgi:hypothetical protein
MSTDRETTRVVRSWLDDGVTKLPDRVLDAVLDQVPTTPQRRSGWSAWRSYRMNTYVRVAVAAAAVLVVAVVGYQLLPRNGGPGGQPTVAPSPSPSLLAKGTFVVAGSLNTTLDATGSKSNVSGTVTARDGAQSFTVDLQCERTFDGVLWIGGDVTESSYADTPKGTRTAILLKPGSPVQGIVAFQGADPPSASCQAFFDDMVALGIEPSGLPAIEGTVELAP